MTQSTKVSGIQRKLLQPEPWDEVIHPVQEPLSICHGVWRDSATWGSFCTAHSPPSHREHSIIPLCHLLPAGSPGWALAGSFPQPQAGRRELTTQRMSRCWGGEGEGVWGLRQPKQCREEVKVELCVSKGLVQHWELVSTQYPESGPKSKG